MKKVASLDRTPDPPCRSLTDQALNIAKSTQADSDPRFLKHKLRRKPNRIPDSSCRNSGLRPFLTSLGLQRPSSCAQMWQPGGWTFLGSLALFNTTLQGKPLSKKSITGKARHFSQTLNPTGICAILGFSVIPLSINDEHKYLSSRCCG